MRDQASIVLEGKPVMNGAVWANGTLGAENGRTATAGLVNLLADSAGLHSVSAAAAAYERTASPYGDRLSGSSSPALVLPGQPAALPPVAVPPLAIKVLRQSLSRQGSLGKHEAGAAARQHASLPGSASGSPRAALDGPNQGLSGAEAPLKGAGGD